MAEDAIWANEMREKLDALAQDHKEGFGKLVPQAAEVLQRDVVPLLIDAFTFLRSRAIPARLEAITYGATAGALLPGHRPDRKVVGLRLSVGEDDDAESLDIWLDPDKTTQERIPAIFVQTKVFEQKNIYSRGDPSGSTRANAKASILAFLESALAKYQHEKTLRDTVQKWQGLFPKE